MISPYMHIFIFLPSQSPWVSLVSFLMFLEGVVHLLGKQFEVDVFLKN